jgi:hypothetical protein
MLMQLVQAFALVWRLWPVHFRSHSSLVSLWTTHQDCQIPTGREQKMCSESRVLVNIIMMMTRTCAGAGLLAGGPLWHDSVDCGASTEPEY